MLSFEMFDMIKSISYKHAGLGGDYAVVVNDDDKTVYVVFEETNGIVDWSHNFQLLPKRVKPYKNMKDEWYAHEGFVKVWHSIRDACILDVKKLIEDPSLKSYCICCTGWSHGGALAQLCAEDLAYNGIKCTYRTFGSPKVFYGKCTKEHLEKLPIIPGICYENGSDIVPIVPIGAFCLNRTHVGERFNILKTVAVKKYHKGYGDPSIYYYDKSTTRCLKAGACD